MPERLPAGGTADGAEPKRLFFGVAGAGVMVEPKTLLRCGVVAVSGAEPKRLLVCVLVA